MHFMRERHSYASTGRQLSTFLAGKRRSEFEQRGKVEDESSSTSQTAVLRCVCRVARW